MVEWHEYREVEQSIIYPKSIQRCILSFQSMPGVSAIALLSCGVHGASDVICPSLAAGDDIIANPALRNLQPYGITFSSRVREEPGSLHKFRQIPMTS